MTNNNQSSLVKNGYQVIRNAIPNKLIKKIQIESLKAIKGKHTGNLYKNFNLKLKKNLISEYKFVKPINESLIYKNLISEILLSKKLFNYTKSLIGSDLAYLDDNVMASRDMVRSGYINNNFLVTNFSKK